MIVKTCSRCKETQHNSLTWTTCAWVRADHVRVAYKHMLCDTCIVAKIAPVHTGSESPEMHCPNCGIDTAEDFDAIYVTFIPRGFGKFRADAPFCAPCAAHFRIWFIEGATELEDRNQGLEAVHQASRPTAQETLAALGLADYYRPDRV